MFILSLCATCSAGIHHVIRKAASDWLLKFMNINPLTAKFFCVDWQVLWVLLYHANTHSDIFEHYIKFDQHIQMCLFVEKYIT